MEVHIVPEGDTHCSDVNDWFTQCTRLLLQTPLCTRKLASM